MISEVREVMPPLPWCLCLCLGIKTDSWELQLSELPVLKMELVMLVSFLSSLLRATSEPGPPTADTDI